MVKEVTENEQIEGPLNGKIFVVIDSILALGLNEQTLTKRKENIKRPENCIKTPASDKGQL